MLNSLNIGLSGLEQFQQEISVIGNNVANISTTGYKSGRVMFADSFSQTLQSSSGGSGVASNTPSVQVGTGVATAAIQNAFTQGPVSATEEPSHLAIKGNGFFVVRDPLTNAEYLTRAGDFRLDSAGRLVTSSGMRVQGYTDSGLSTMGDLVVDATGAPAGATGGVNSYSFDAQGKLTVKLSDNTTFVRGQVLMQHVTDPQALFKEGGNLYSGQANAGALAAPAAAGTNGLGTIQGYALEGSNVDLSAELTGLISTQRAFQASSRLITTTDDLMQEIVNLKR